MLGNSSIPNYLKVIASVILVTTYLAALGIAIIEYGRDGNDVQLPAIVTFILGTGLTTALQILNLHAAVSQGTPSAPPPPTVTTVTTATTLPSNTQATQAPKE